MNVAKTAPLWVCICAVIPAASTTHAEVVTYTLEDLLLDDDDAHVGLADRSGAKHV